MFIFLCSYAWVRRGWDVLLSKSLVIYISPQDSTPQIITSTKGNGKTSIYKKTAKQHEHKLVHYINQITIGLTTGWIQNEISNL